METMMKLSDRFNTSKELRDYSQKFQLSIGAKLLTKMFILRNEISCANNKATSTTEEVILFGDHSDFYDRD